LVGPPLGAFVLLQVLGVAEVVAALFVLMRAPGRRTNQFLSGLLISDGANQFSDGLEFWLRFTEPGRFLDEQAGLTAVEQTTLPLVVLFSLLFIGAALDHPWTRPLRRPIVQIALLLLAALVLAAGLLGINDLLPSKPAVDNLVTAIVLLIVSTFSLVVAFMTFRRAPKGTLARERAAAYTIAFGIRDFTWGLGPSIFFLIGWVNKFQMTPAAVHQVSWYYLVGGILMVAFLVALLYGLLRLQIIDFPKTVRFTISRGAIAAIFFATFFVVSELAATFFVDWTGSRILGILAAGLLLFALTPLQRATDRLAQRAAPPTDLNEEQRLELYREQVALAWQDRTIRAKEREILRNLRERLRLSREAAGRVELEVMEGGVERQAAGL
jgi:hypothetical protein